MRTLLSALIIAICVFPAASNAQIPVWHNTLDDATLSTINGGVRQGAAPTFASFGLPDGGNGYVSAGDSRFFWGVDPVKAIFTGWDDTAGITIDLFIRGYSNASMSGDQGLWSVGHRNADNFILVQFRDNALRIVLRNDSGTGSGRSYAFGAQSGADPFEPPIPLTLDANTTYRITVRQHSSLDTANNKLGQGAGGDLEVYLEGGSYSGLLGALDLPTGFSFNFPLETGSGTGTTLGMSVGNRHPFATAAASPKAGQGIDNVRIYNGSYTPAQIPVPVAGMPVAVASVDVNSGFAPLTVQFNGSGSYDTGTGTITGYQWDFDNNGTLDATGVTVGHTYTAAGTYTCKLTVIDNDNNTASALVPISVHPAPANGLLMITAMEPSGTMAAGSYLLTSVSSRRVGSTQTFTDTDLVGPPSTENVEVIGSGITGGGAGATTAAEAFVGLELGSTVSGVNDDSKSLTGYFPASLLIQPDGTAAPEIFFIESSASTDDFQIQLLTSGPGAASVEIAAVIQVRSIDYVSTSTVIGSTPRGGVAIDLDAIGVGAIRGVRIPGGNGSGGGSGIDPVLVAAVPVRCNTPSVDGDGDGDVDQADFAALQRCITRSNDPNSRFDLTDCRCFDSDQDADIDEFDFNAFAHCATGPAIPWSQALAPGCQP